MLGRAALCMVALLAAAMLVAPVVLAQPATPEATAAGKSEQELRAELQQRADSGQATAAELRQLGEMYASGVGGRRDARRAVRLWERAAEAGDRYAPTLLGDHHFKVMTRGQLPKEGTIRFSGSIQIEPMRQAAKWYGEAVKRDDRADAKSRAQIGLQMLEGIAKVSLELAKARR